MEQGRSENITITGAVAQFGIGRTKLYELIQQGKIDAFKLGRRTLVRAASVQAFVESLPRIGPMA